MIPKTIHYCWFGHGPMPKLAEICIESWKRFLPDYEIKRWDESNFDVNICRYTREAYERKKYAFVSDYARFYILNKEGGLYFDVDVEIIAPFDKIIKSGSFMGLETGLMVNPGLGMSSEANNPFLSELLRNYDNLSFIKPDGSLNVDTVGFYTTKLLQKYGWNGSQNEVAGFKIYPKDFLCPIDYETKKLRITSNTVTIHHYNESWLTGRDKLYRSVKKMFGQKFATFCSKIFKSVFK